MSSTFTVVHIPWVLGVFARLIEDLTIGLRDKILCQYLSFRVNQNSKLCKKFYASYFLLNVLEQFDPSYIFKNKISFC